MKLTTNFFRYVVVLAVITLVLLLIPLVAMQYTNEVVWTLSDFIIAGTMLFGTGLAYKLITVKANSLSYKIAVGLALFSGLFLVWANLAVGLIGSEDNPYNLTYFLVLAVGLVGSLLARFHANGMKRALYAMAACQGVITFLALYLGMQDLPYSSVTEILGVNATYIFLYLLSALFFRHAALRRQEA
jgi:hypothetical protein